LAQGQSNRHGGGAADVAHHCGIHAPLIQLHRLERIQPVHRNPQPLPEDLGKVDHLGAAAGEEHPVQPVHLEAGPEEIDGPPQLVGEAVGDGGQGRLHLFGAAAFGGHALLELFRRLPGNAPVFHELVGEAVAAPGDVAPEKRLAAHQHGQVGELGADVDQRHHLVPGPLAGADLVEVLDGEHVHVHQHRLGAGHGHAAEVGLDLVLAAGHQDHVHVAVGGALFQHREIQGVGVQSLARGEEAFRLPAHRFRQFGRTHEGKCHFLDHHLLAGHGDGDIPGFYLLLGEHLADRRGHGVAVHDVALDDGVEGQNSHAKLLQSIALAAAFAGYLQLADLHRARADIQTN